MMERDQEIECSICRRANPGFEALSQQINQARTPSEKAPHARALIEKVEAVVNEHKGSSGALATACMTLLNLRKPTAELILGFQRR